MIIIACYKKYDFFSFLVQTTGLTDNLVFENFQNWRLHGFKNIYIISDKFVIKTTETDWLAAINRRAARAKFDRIPFWEYHDKVSRDISLISTGEKTRK